MKNDYSIVLQSLLENHEYLKKIPVDIIVSIFDYLKTPSLPFSLQNGGGSPNVPIKINGEFPDLHRTIRHKSQHIPYSRTIGVYFHRRSPVHFNDYLVFTITPTFQYLMGLTNTNKYITMRSMVDNENGTIHHIKTYFHRGEISLLENNEGEDDMAFLSIYYAFTTGVLL